MMEALFAILNSVKVCILDQEQYGSTTLRGNLWKKKQGACS